MADNELIILLKMDTGPAAQAEAAYHQRARGQARETEEENKKLDAERIRSVRENIAYRIRTHKEADAQILKGAKELEAQQKALDAERLRSVKENIAYRVRLHKEEAAEVERARKAAIAGSKEAVDAAKLAAAEKTRAEKEAASQQKALDEERLRSVKENLAYRAAEEKRLLTVEKEYHTERDRITQQGMAFRQRMRKQQASEEKAEAVAAERAEKARQKELENSNRAILNVARAYTLLRIASEVSQVMNQGMKMVGDEVHRVRDYINEVVQSMRTMRDSMAEIAYYKGEIATGDFVARFAQRAEKVGVDVPTLRGAEEEFLKGSAGAIGTKITKEEGEELVNITTGAAMKMGVKPAEAIGLLNAMIETEPVDAKGKIDKHHLLREMSGEMKLAQMAPTGTREAVVQLSRSIRETQMEPGTRGQWSDITATMMHYLPQSSHVYVRRFAESMAKMKPEQLQELGIDEHMAPQEKVMAMIAAYQASGGDTSQRRFFREAGFKETRGESAALQLMLQQGKGKIDQYKNIRESATEGEFIKMGQEFTGEDRSRDMVNKAAGIRADAVAGQRNLALKRRHEEIDARIRVDPSYFEKRFPDQWGIIDSLIRDQGKKLGTPEYRQAVVEEIAAYEMQREAEQAATSKDPMIRQRGERITKKFHQPKGIEGMHVRAIPFPPFILPEMGEVPGPIRASTPENERADIANQLEVVRQRRELEKQTMLLQEANKQRAADANGKVYMMMGGAAVQVR